jgi:hypothetical protein
LRKSNCELTQGEITKRQVDRDYPHQIAILVPGTGLGERLMAMRRFCNARALPYKTRPDRRHQPPGVYMRFCFQNAAHADAFHTEFGGERFVIEPR